MSTTPIRTRTVSRSVLRAATLGAVMLGVLVVPYAGAAGDAGAGLQRLRRRRGAVRS